MAESKAAPPRPYIIAQRRERVFLLLAGIFLGTLAMLNIIGITKFLDLGYLSVPVGVLPYPLTFLCTDLISEFYGKRRANFVVFVGLVLNIFVIAILLLGQVTPRIGFQMDFQRISSVRYETIMDAEGKAPDKTLRSDGQPVERLYVVSKGQRIPVSEVRLEALRDPETNQVIIDPQTKKPVGRLVEARSGQAIVEEDTLFNRIYLATMAAVFASMLAYLAAQFVDVQLFHFWKRLTKGKHLWLRNNGSTLISQLVDATAVVSITFGAAVVSGEQSLLWLFGMIASNYVFKLLVALADTPLIYVAVYYLKDYLEIDPTTERDLEQDMIVFSPQSVE